MILQAYDFLELHNRYGCMLQMGGSDQMGNIINGMELTRRVAEDRVFGLTSPLLTTSDGKKMGKSQNGAVWLNADMLSPYEFWQFWRNTTDADGTIRNYTPNCLLQNVIALVRLRGLRLMMPR